MHGSAVHSNAESGTGSEQIAYTVPHAAQLLDLGERTVWQLVKAEEDDPGTGIESVKIGWSRRVPRVALLAYMERKRAQGRVSE
ncbi:helix-turn-helix domain-containing protein [Salinispora arenicola]|uniref:helix-turn-helix domain-containing protein n=1 Tax=Salinispora arenicola TaxID=168697 RepID=UPI00037B3A24|nr:helix-turn-helix domain-containing protein [Salinispora arenicola]